MHEVTLIVPKADKESVVDQLRGKVQLKEVTVENARKLYPDIRKLEETSSRIDALIERFKPKGKAKKSASPVIDAEELAIELQTRLGALDAKQKDVEKQVRNLKVMLEVLDTEQVLGRVQLASFSNEEWEIRRPVLIEGGARIIATRLSENTVVVLGKGLPEGIDGTYGSIRGSLVEKMKALRAQKAELSTQAVLIAEEHGGRLNTLKRQLDAELKVLYEKRKLAHSELFTFLNGWMPDSGLDAVKDLPNALVFVQDAGEDAPTKLENPWFFRPFENFMYIFALPKYGEIDPTPFISIFFPLFYGIMIGDAGYGILLLMLALALRRRQKLVSEILILPAISAILFGVFFDSYFGIELGRHLLSPLNRPFELLYYAFVIGVFYVDLGLVMGLIQNLLKDEYYDALTEQFSLLLFQFGLAIAFISALPGMVLLVAGLGLKIHRDGLRGFLELPSFFSAILSFLRIAAIALSGVWIGFTINLLSGIVSGLPYGLLPAALMFCLGHLAIFAFASFGAFIHALRLHYVEFMGLFFTAKGKPYTPLGE